MHDVIVVGGSYAGLAATLQIARARRRVLVVDAGVRRNRTATHAHGFLGQDGRDPAEIAAIGRAEVLAYPTVTWVEGLVAHARATGDGFTVALASGAIHEAKRLLLAVGVVDDLPEIEGVSARWGRSIFACPYCHGYELGGGRIGVIATSPMSVHHARMLPDWGETTYFTRGIFAPSEEERAAIEKRGTTIDETPVVAIEGDAPEAIVRLADGRALPFAGLFLMSKPRIASPLVAELGCALEAGPVAPFVQTDMTKETSVRGVFACGDLALPMPSIALAVADGVRAGAGVHQSLMFR